MPKTPKTVADIMTREVVSVSPKTSVTKISELIINHHLTGIPVVDDGKIVGIITDKDVVAQKSKLHIPDYLSILGAYLQLSPAEQVEHEIHKILGTTAEEIMTKKVITINAEALIEDLATLMVDESVNPVPVVDDQSRVVGIVSRYDLAKLLILQ